MLLLHVENAKSPYRGRGDTPLPPLEAPSDNGVLCHRILDTDFLFSKVGRYDVWAFTSSNKNLKQM